MPDVNFFGLGGPLASPAADDLIPIWDTSAAQTLQIRRDVFVGATITGGGTIATGGFTLTVPASGTAALVAYNTVTPTIVGGSTPGTYTISNNISRYIKVGKLVIVSYSFNVTVDVAGTGYIKIGLPFATVANSIAIGPCDIDGADYSAGYTSLIVKPDSTSSTLYAYIAQNGDNVSTLALPITALTTGDKITFTLIYESAA